MSLITQLLQSIDEDSKRIGESQCFISHEFRDKDLRRKLKKALEQLGLRAYFADEEVTGDFLLHKVCKKILAARASMWTRPSPIVQLGGMTEYRNTR